MDVKKSLEEFMKNYESALCSVRTDDNTYVCANGTGAEVLGHLLTTIVYLAEDIGISPFELMGRVLTLLAEGEDDEAVSDDTEDSSDQTN